MYLKEELLGTTAILSLAVWGVAKMFPTKTLYFHQQCYKGSSFSTSLSILVTFQYITPYIGVCIYIYPSKCEVVPYCGLVCISLMPKNIVHMHLFMCLFKPSGFIGAQTKSDKVMVLGFTVYTKGANGSLEAEKCHHQKYKVCSEECTVETEHQLEGCFSGPSEGQCEPEPGRRQWWWKEKDRPQRHHPFSTGSNPCAVIRVI